MSAEGRAGSGAAFDEVLHAVESGKYTVVVLNSSARASLLGSSAFSNVQRLRDYLRQHGHFVFTETIQEGAWG